MKRVKVEIPFHMITTNTDHVPGDIIDVSEEQLSKILSININMVSVLGDAEPAAQEPEAQEPAETPKKRNYKRQQNQ